MATYMVQVSYTVEKWKDMVFKGGKKGSCTSKSTVEPVIKKLGGKVICRYVSFGSYDVVVIYEIPDSLGATAVSAALASTGIFKTIETTALMPPDEADQGLAKAKAAGYGG